MTRIGERIRSFRVAAKLQQQDLALRIGVTSNYISMLERNEREPSLTMLSHIAEKLGVPLSMFFLPGEFPYHIPEGESSVQSLSARLQTLIVELASAGPNLASRRESKTLNLHDLAAQLDESPSTLSDFSEQFPRYTARSVETKGGKRRRTLSPDATLKQIQSKIHSRILSKIDFPTHVQAYIPGRSYISNARAHLGSRYFCLLDVADFFPSTPFELVRDVFHSLGYRGHALMIITRLTTFSRKLPQGAPTSPLLANLAFMPVDELLLHECRRFGLKYTRYSDDLTFSSKQDFEEFIPSLKGAIEGTGYRLAPKKGGYFRPGDSVQVTGVSLRGGKMYVPEIKVAQVVDMINNLALTLEKSPDCQNPRKSVASIEGSLAHIHSIDSKLGKQLRMRLESVLKSAA